MKKEKRKSERRRSTRFAYDKDFNYVPPARIRINVLTSTPSPAEQKATAKKQELDAAVRAFERTNGKMFNCIGCGHRHNGAKCELQYHIGRKGRPMAGQVLIAPKTRKGVLGAVAFNKKRFRPHRNQKTLLTIQTAKEILHAFETNYPGQQPDPSRVIRDAIRVARGRRQSYNPYRRREVIAGLSAELAA